MMRPLQPLRLLAFCLLALMFNAVPVVGHAEHGRGAEATITLWEVQLQRAEQAIDGGDLGPLAIENHRADIAEIITSATKLRDNVLATADEIESFLGALGPAPAEGEPPEAADVAVQRAELVDDLSRHRGDAKRTALIIKRAQRVLVELGGLTRSQLTAELLLRTDPPVAVETWSIASQELFDHVLAAFIVLPGNWLKAVAADAALTAKVVLVTGLAVLIALASFPVRRWLRRQFGWGHFSGEPDYGDRLIAAVTEGACRGLIPVVFVLVLGGLVGSLSVTTPEFKLVIDSVTRAFAVFFFSYGVINAVFTPHHPKWRITRLGDKASRLVVVRLKLVIIIYLTFSALYGAIEYRPMTVAFESVFALVFTVSLYVTMFALLRPGVWEPDSPPEGAETAIVDVDSMFGKLRSLLSIGFVVLPLSALIGYPKLALFLADGILLSFIVAGGLWVLRFLFRICVSGPVCAETETGKWMRRHLGLGPDGARTFTFWINLVVDICLLAVASALLLPVWGYGDEEALVWLMQIFRGVQIGDFTFSLADVLLAIALFAAVTALTRLLQRALDRHLLPNVFRDKGVSDAVRTGIGYVGIVVAALVAISTVGLDLSNLALVAGALTVGLGFGLQNVVNNFVSGIILLIERPIKQGDWVIAGGHEGTVKNINVRSTEIETFQRASVIIPNADLISSPVTNWTHKNHFGRIEIPVGVSYNSDPEQVRDILLEIGNNHPDVLKTPACYVLFKNFGDSSLDFELRCYLRDIDYFIPIISDIRYAIVKAFRENGIEIPFPQRVLHMAHGADQTPVPVTPEEAAKEAEHTGRAAGDDGSDGGAPKKD